MVNSPSAGRCLVNVIVLLTCASPFTMCVRFLLAGSVIFSVQVLPCYRSTSSAPTPSPGSYRPVRKAAAYSAPCQYTCGYFSGQRCPAARFPVGCAALRCRIAAQKIRHEVLFSYDNSYYTHCYHQTVKEYKSNGSLIRSKTDYYQAIGG